MIDGTLNQARLLFVPPIIGRSPKVAEYLHSARMLRKTGRPDDAARIEKLVRMLGWGPTFPPGKMLALWRRPSP